MNFNKWVARRGGPRVLAREIDASPRTVHYWLKGKIVPRLDMYLKIKALSKGKITPEKMLEKFLEVNSNTKDSGR